MDWADGKHKWALKSKKGGKGGHIVAGKLVRLHCEGAEFQLSWPPGGRISCLSKHEPAQGSLFKKLAVFQWLL